jgi:hypothetical protein
MKVGREEIVGMVVAVETFVNKRNLQSEFREWESWYAHITERITKVPGIKTEVRGPQRGGPFPTLTVSWDPNLVGLTAGQVGRLLLEGEPRIMSHASGDGYSFLIRPAALRPDDYKIVAERLTQIFRSAPKGVQAAVLAAPKVEIDGRWEVSIQYESGSAEHKLFLNTQGNKISGTHLGWTFQGELKGLIDGDKVRFQSALDTGGQDLTYAFSGQVSGDTMSGDLDVGEYGRARWTARLHKAIA